MPQQSLPPRDCPSRLADCKTPAGSQNLVALVATIALTLAASPISASEPKEPPHLWSWIKDLNKSREACEIQSAYALRKLKLSSQVENDYGIYGTVKGNRVVVKCIAISDTSSKVLVAVAGINKDAVERVRNEIVKAIN